MLLLRLIASAIALALALAPAAHAQFPPTPQQQQQCNQIGQLVQTRNTRGEALKAAGDRKASPQEACTLVKAYQDAERKLIKAVDDHGAACGAPPNVAEQLKAAAVQTAKIRGNICSAAAAPRAPPAPTLGDVLGTTRVPDATTTRTGRGGAFDTLTGNPIAR